MVPYTAGWEPSVSSSLASRNPERRSQAAVAPAERRTVPGVEAGRANRRDTDELVELAADQGNADSMAALAAAGLRSGKFRPSVPQVASRPAIAPKS